MGYVCEKLRDVYSFTSIARELNLLISTIIRYFDLVSYAKPKVLPNVIAIDEFKGNTDNEKYLGIITDPEHGIVLDILPTRHNHYLSHYFSQYTTAQRNDVRACLKKEKVLDFCSESRDFKIKTTR